ncbi:MAG TPA: uroporphyrinogen-III C-methyltransferase [Candidatus Contendobacter sp.]|nr:uroporphyrinogen-III C-methyltransferase [Candidatus Contendobacter sp.]HRD50325.1 uroporphyrinogen-III C-methyltransferase [Candidatus Contendobacter sp.]
MTNQKSDNDDSDKAAPVVSAAPQNSPSPPLAKEGGDVGRIPAAPRSGRGLAGFALLVALGASGGSGYLWYLWQQEQATQLSRLNQAIKQAIAQPSTDLQGLQAQVKELQALKTALDQARTENQNLKGQILGLTGDLQPLKNTMELYKGENEIIKGEMKLLRESHDTHKTSVQQQKAELDQQLQEQQNRLAKLNEYLQNLRLSHSGLAENLETVKAVAAKGGDINAFPLAEVDYLLRLADAKLKLERNLATARIALDAAQQRLKAVGESAMTSVQTMIGEAIASLRGVQLPDITALAHKIVQMEKEVASLPLQIKSGTPDIKQAVKPAATATVSADADRSWWDRTSQAVWDQFKGIVIIRRVRSEAPPLIAMEEDFFLRQNLQLELESMRMALLRGDAQTYQDSNELVRQWVTTYFDAEDAQVATFLSELKALQTVQFNPYIPDLAGLNQAFREALDRRQPIRPVLIKTPATNAQPTTDGEARP